MNKKSLGTLLSGIFLLAALILLSACSEAEESVSQSKVEESPVQQEQIEAINTAREIKVPLQDITGLYRELPVLHPPRTDDKVEVVEIFYYGCPHCYSFEPTIEKWLEKKADYIKFIRMPGVLGKNWLPHARAFYTAQKLGVLDKIHRPLFNAIHKEKRKIMDKKELKKFFVEHGVSGDSFDQVYESRAVEENIRAAYLAGQRYQLTGVPAVIINGKYGTSPSMAGSYNKVMDVINTLAAKEHEKLPD